MKKIFFILSFVWSVIYLIACSQHESNPSTVLTSFFTAIGKKDIAAAKKLATFGSQGTLDIFEQGLTIAKDNTILDEMDLKKMEIGIAQIDGDDAVVPVKYRASGVSVNYPLRREDGTWKVEFTENAISNMVGNKMKEKLDTETMNRAAEELKHLNMDSLNESLKENLKAVDEAQ